MIDFQEIEQLAATLGFRKAPGGISITENLLLQQWRRGLAEEMRAVGLTGKLNPITERFFVPVYQEAVARKSFQYFRMNDGFDGIVIPDALFERHGEAFRRYLSAMKDEHGWHLSHRGLLHPSWFR